MSINSGPLLPFKALTAAPTFADSQEVQGSIDTSDGGLRVHLMNGSSGGTSALDNSAFTVSVTPGTPAMGVFNDGLAALSSGRIAIPRITDTRGLHVNLRNASGTEIGVLAAALRIDPVGTTSQPVVGAAASGATPSGNPVRTGIRSSVGTTLPTGVAAGQVVDPLADLYGRQIFIAPVLTTASSAGTAITTNTNTQLVAAPSAGFHLRIHRLWAQNSSATGTWCYWGNGSGVKTLPFYVAQYQPFSMAVNGEWELSTATGLFMNTATTGANVEWFVAFETLKDS